MTKSLLTLLVAGTVMLGNANTVHATMIQDEATEWHKKWCEENRVDFEDSRSTGGMHKIHWKYLFSWQKQEFLLFSCGSVNLKIYSATFVDKEYTNGIYYNHKRNTKQF